MNGNPENFGDDFAEFVRKTLDRADKMKRAVGFKLFSAVIKDTPVGNPDIWKHPKAPEGYVGGRLRANWTCTLHAPATSSSLSTAHRGAIPAMQETVFKGNRNTVDFLTNNLVYAKRIEYDGHSKQAPAGMVRKNVVRFRRLISQELQRLRKA